MKRMSRANGFSLIELIIVIVLVSILYAVASPRFASVRSDGLVAANKTVAGAYHSAVNIARISMQAQSGSGPAEDVKVYSNGGVNGLVDFNANGWPSQSWTGGIEANPSTDNVNDCLSLWSVLMSDESERVSSSVNEDYQAQYLGGNRCRYIAVQSPTLSFDYYSLTGEIIVDSFI